MRLGTLILFSLLLAAARPCFAACGDQPADAKAVADTRSDAASQCDCPTATSHADYVACVLRAATAAVRAGTLRPQCRAAIVRCAARSTCGRAGFVTCCHIRADGSKRCGVRIQGQPCLAPSGGTACAGSAS